MNTALVADGLAAGGPDLARRMLKDFWIAVGQMAAAAPIQPTPMDRLTAPGTMRFSPTWMATDAMLKLFSPYQLNPLNQNPLRQLLEETVDFPRLRMAEQPAAFVCATNVLNGRLKVFARHEMSAAAVMASACLPQLFQAVEVDGDHYWDGGYSGNPPIFPLIYMGGCPDIIIVQLNPINIPTVPRDMRAIMDRINTLAFNSSLMGESICGFSSIALMPRISLRGLTRPQSSMPHRISWRIFSILGSHKLMPFSPSISRP
jgi:NTE family protein